MANKTGKQYIADNDLEGAIERFENSYKNWKSHWFSVCQTIMENCKDWGKKYILDPITQTIRVIGDMIKKAKPKDTSQKSHTYLIKMYNNNGEWVYTKIGKANIIDKRLKQHHKTFKDGQTIVRCEIIKEYELPNDDLAQVLESFMRGYFRKTRTFIPNDRFVAFEPTEEDLAVFKQYYDLTVASA